MDNNIYKEVPTLVGVLKPKTPEFEAYCREIAERQFFTPEPRKIDTTSVASVLGVNVAPQPKPPQIEKKAPVLPPKKKEGAIGIYSVWNVQEKRKITGLRKFGVVFYKAFMSVHEIELIEPMKNAAKYLKTDDVKDILWAEYQKIVFSDGAKRVDFRPEMKNVFCGIVDWLQWKDGLFNPEKGFFFTGAKGVSKTCLLKTIQKTLILFNDIRAFRIVSMPSFCLDFCDGRDYSKIRDVSLKNVAFDDIGYSSENILDYGNKVNLVDAIFSHRNNEFVRIRATTYLTTNCLLQDLPQLYDSRTIDRFRQMTNLVILHGSSFRK